MWALLLAAALAQDAATPPADVPDPTKVVGPVVADQEVLVLGAGNKPFKFKVADRYWLIRDDALRTAVANARIVPRLEDSLRQCSDAALECGTSAASSWATMRQQFAADDAEMDRLVGDNARLAGEVTQLRTDLQRARSQRNVAYGVGGGVVVAIVIGLSLGLAH